MSENAVELVTEEVSETVNELPQVVDTVEQEPAFEQAEQPEVTAKKAASFKDIVAFAQTHIFTAKVCRIALLAVGGVMTLLTLLQMLFWGLEIKDSYMNYWNVLVELDYINIVVLALTLLFVVVLLIMTVKSIVTLTRKDHVPCVAMVTTLFTFSLFASFVQKVVGSGLLAEDFSFSPIMGILLGLMVTYSLLRAFGKDLPQRLWSLVFGSAAVVIVLVMYYQNAGDFVSMTVGNTKFSLGDLNIFRYMEAVFARGEIITGEESLFYLAGVYITPDGWANNMEKVVILLQMIPVAVANVLPYAAISMLGYLMTTFTDHNYMQYHSLNACRKLSVTMLVVSLMSVAANVGMYFLAKTPGAVLVGLIYTKLEVELNYTNMILTVVLCIGLIVVTAMPWKIYEGTYLRRYAAYQKQ